MYALQSAVSRLTTPKEYRLQNYMFCKSVLLKFSFVWAWYPTFLLFKNLKPLLNFFYNVCFCANTFTAHIRSFIRVVNYLERHSISTVLSQLDNYIISSLSSLFFRSIVFKIYNSLLFCHYGLIKWRQGKSD